MKLLFLTQNGQHGPSSRYRVYQLVPHLEKLGITCVVSPAIDDELYHSIYLSSDGRGGCRRTAFLETWRRRQADVARIQEFDAVFVQKGVFPGLYAGFERRLAARRPLVFDFDDTIWLPREGGHPLLRTLHREGTVHEILRCATAVIAGNEFLAEYAQRFNPNVTVVPSSIDVARYRRSDDSVVIGWIGSRTTLPYLKPLAVVFKALSVKPRVIASGDPSTLGFEVEFRPWRLETELDELARIGIGIAPLPDTPWERGKCGVKLLQYMACGVPVVASPVGVQQQIIRDRENGLLARDEEEWRRHLTALMGDAGLRARLGAAARKTVERHYDVRAAAGNVANVLAASTQTNGITGRLNRRSA